MIHVFLRHVTCHQVWTLAKNIGTLCLPITWALGEIFLFFNCLIGSEHLEIR